MSGVYPGCLTSLSMGLGWLRWGFCKKPLFSLEPLKIRATKKKKIYLKEKEKKKKEKKTDVVA